MSLSLHDLSIDTNIKAIQQHLMNIQIMEKPLFMKKTDFWQSLMPDISRTNKDRMNVIAYL